MPAKYVAIRDALMKKGMPEQEAKAHAARIYNKGRKKGQKPVTRNYKE